MIRRAIAADEGPVTHCARAAHALYTPRIGREPAPLSADYGAPIARGDVHVACGDGGRLLGFIVSFPEDGHMPLENVAVRRNAAGRGLGCLPIGFCEREARRLGPGAVRLHSNEAMVENRAIYCRLGYVEVARRLEDGFRRVLFEKRLGTE